MKTLTMVAAAALVLFATNSKAGTIPYPNTGTIAPTNTFTAIATGDITGYFVQGGALTGGDATNDDQIEMIDLTTDTNSGFLFDNQTTTAGTSADFGAVNAGDTLEFVLEDINYDYTVSSIPANSADGVNHVYATDWAGGTLNGAAIPAGTFVGFEDLLVPGSDLNYNDDTFVFTDVSATSITPEPGSLYLLGTGLLGLAGLVRRKIRA